jgi:hypothetical protein
VCLLLTTNVIKCIKLGTKEAIKIFKGYLRFMFMTLPEGVVQNRRNLCDAEMMTLMFSKDMKIFMDPEQVIFQKVTRNAPTLLSFENDFIRRKWYDVVTGEGHRRDSKWRNADYLERIHQLEMKNFYETTKRKEVVAQTEYMITMSVVLKLWSGLTYTRSYTTDKVWKKVERPIGSKGEGRTVLKLTEVPDVIFRGFSRISAEDMYEMIREGDDYY